MSEDLQERVKSALVRGKLPCAVAFDIAKQVNVSPRQVKDVAEEMGIKISACQLGCFP